MILAFLTCARFIKMAYQMSNMNGSTSRIFLFKIVAVLAFSFAFLFVKGVDTPAVDAAVGAGATSVGKAGVVQAAQTLADIGLGQAPGAPTPNVSIGYDSLYMTLGILVGVLLLVVLLLVFIAANLTNLVRVREGKEAYSFAKTLATTKEYALNPYVASIGSFVVLIVSMFFIVPVARGVGHSQNYQPTQPIWFSHKIHAGTQKIDCQYCHTGAAKGKNAWIPAVTVCMNCHKAIKEGTITGTTEISKISAAYEANMPIEWVRIHNLPDLSYFNHQQHVVVGGVECKTCHGPIEEMDEVYQYNTLSMGWCINCHRETEVNKDLYEKLGRTDVVTVADQGGLECARCHY
jgi:cytochrome c553